MRVVTCSREITEVKQRRAQSEHWMGDRCSSPTSSLCRGVGQGTHIMPPLSTQQWWVPVVTKTLGELWMALTAENALHSHPRKWDRIKEFQYQGCKLWSLLNSRGYQTINIHIYIYIFVMCAINSPIYDNENSRALSSIVTFIQVRTISYFTH